MTKARHALCIRRGEEHQRCENKPAQGNALGNGSGMDSSPVGARQRVPPFQGWLVCGPLALPHRLRRKCMTSSSATLNEMRQLEGVICASQQSLWIDGARTPPFARLFYRRSRRYSERRHRRGILSAKGPRMSNQRQSRTEQLAHDRALFLRMTLIDICCGPPRHF